jgi:hypothetical protein
MLAHHARNSAPWLDLGDITPPLVGFFSSRGTPGFYNGHKKNGLPLALSRAIHSLERRLYVEYDAQNKKVRLTSLGAYVAALHELPSELDRAAAS